MESYLTSPIPGEGKGEAPVKKSGGEAPVKKSGELSIPDRVLRSLGMERAPSKGEVPHSLASSKGGEVSSLDRLASSKGGEVSSHTHPLGTDADSSKGRPPSISSKVSPSHEAKGEKKGISCRRRKISYQMLLERTKKLILAHITGLKQREFIGKRLVLHVQWMKHEEVVILLGELTLNNRKDIYKLEYNPSTSTLVISSIYL